MQVAGQVARVNTLFESTREYFRPYLTEEAPHFTITTTQADMDLIQKLRIEEAIREGIRIRRYNGPYLERASVQLKFAEHLLHHRTLLFHGSAVALDGEGYLFTADCGVGKSTHTRLWREVFGHRAVMINDDKPFLRLTGQGVLICGSPWSGKHGLDTNITVPLKGICILHRGPENKIAPLAPEAAMSMLLKQSHQPLDAAMQAEYLSLVDTLAAIVPLWQMECNKNPQAALVSQAAMGKYSTTPRL